MEAVGGGGRREKRKPTEETTRFKRASHVAVWLEATGLR